MFTISSLGKCRGEETLGSLGTQIEKYIEQPFDESSDEEIHMDWSYEKFIEA